MTKRLGAATDDPKALIARAIREYDAARGDPVGIREAANKGWLAICSLADVAAARFGMQEPGGASGRRVAIKELEKRAKIRRGTVQADFEMSRAILHGECFHADTCPVNTKDLLEGLSATIDDGMKALDKATKRRRR